MNIFITVMCIHLCFGDNETKSIPNQKHNNNKNSKLEYDHLGSWYRNDQGK